ncbi:MAG: beta-ketoacyl-ACP synthase III [Bacteroidales bacterium]|nr:beta-ketoacyl-ACP synthase III [Bacteroidales bacterium]
MYKDVYVTKTSHFLPNEAVDNEKMEDYLGKIKGLKSKAKSIILKRNGISQRYYALDKEGNFTHTNVDLTVEAIKKLTDENFGIKDIQLLTCGTASPDYLMPSHANMVQGKLDCNAIDSMSPSGSCNSAMWALNYAIMSLQLGKQENAVCTGSERISTWMLSKNFEEESSHLEALGNNPYIAFEKEFLRWMLSDGAAALLLQNKPSEKGISLKVDWIEIRSYSHLVEACMYAGGVKNETGDLIPWRNFTSSELINQTVLSLKQDARLLENNVVKLGDLFLEDLIEKYNLTPDNIDYFLPHLSSNFFRSKIYDGIKSIGFEIPEEKWFTNLHKYGNVGAASGFLMLDELFNSGKLVKNNKILVMIPESARFSYTFLHLTVV